ncbi:MAG: hypothetical protein AAF196_01845 [Planctomycetota bacterium]
MRPPIGMRSNRRPHETRKGLLWLSAALLSLQAPAPAQDRPVETRWLGRILDEVTLRNPESRLIHDVIFSDGGEVYAYVGCTPGGMVPVFNDELGPTCESVDDPVLDSGGERVVFRALLSSEEGAEKWALYENGEKGPERPWIGPLGMSPDGTLAFWESSKQGRRRHRIVQRSAVALHYGDRSTARFSGMELQLGYSAPRVGQFAGPRFEPGLNAFICLVSRGLSEGALIAPLGRKHQLLFPPWQAESEQGWRVQDIVVSPDGEQIAQTASQRRSFDGTDIAPFQPTLNSQLSPPVIRIGEQVVGVEFEGVDSPTFTPDGSSLAFRFRRGEKMGISSTSDWSTEADWSVVSPPKFTLDGEALIFVGYQGRSFFTPSFGPRLSDSDTGAILGSGQIYSVARSGKPSPMSEEFQKIEKLTWSPDGSKLGFAAFRREEPCQGRWCVFAGETHSEPFDFVGPLKFSADSKLLEFGARNGRDLYWVRLRTDR